MDGNLEMDNKDNTSSEEKCEKTQKYNFRRSSVVKRIRVEENQKLSKQELKSKVKVKEKLQVQPLSKYRRKSANARERSRINDMNLAYEELRHVLPQMSPLYNKNKLSKQTILTLALNYIAALRGMLGYPDHRLNSDEATSSLSSDSEASTSSSGMNLDMSLDTQLLVSDVTLCSVSSTNSDDVMCSASSSTSDEVMCSVSSSTSDDDMCSTSQQSPDDTLCPTSLLDSDDVLISPSLCLDTVTKVMNAEVVFGCANANLCRQSLNTDNEVFNSDSLGISASFASSSSTSNHDVTLDSEESDLG